MDNSKFKDVGIASINKAVELDGENYQEAFKMYIHGLGQLLFAIKYEKNPKSKQVMMHMVNGYITRAETIKESLKREKEVKSSNNYSNNNSPVPVENETDILTNSIKKTMVDSKELGITWDDVVGLEKAKETIKEAVILPLKFPKLYTGKRKPWKGILLYGPPGTGKSFLAKAVASESGSSFFSVSSSDLISKYQGESERSVKALFQLARENAPAVIFIDEIDSLAGDRSDNEQESMRRVKTEFLVQMQGVNESSDESKRLLVLGATNTPWTLDPAFRRRFEKRIFIPLPEQITRTAMFKKFMDETENNITKDEFNKLGEMTENYSGSDISVVLRDALMAPVRACQSAKQFIITDVGAWRPVINYPSCSKCPINLTNNPSTGKSCDNCDARCITLEDIPDPTLLEVPVVTFKDVCDSINRNSSSVSHYELEKYSIWTKTYGQDGN